MPVEINVGVNESCRFEIECPECSDVPASIRHGYQLECAYGNCDL